VLFYLSVHDERREDERCGREEFSRLSRRAVGTFQVLPIGFV
jgi:hypothetical protein